MEASSVEKWGRASEWIHSICVVTFDLELGQAIELIYPENVSLTDKEKMNICYLAFPDSNSGCMGDTRFHVKVRSIVPEASAADREHIRILTQYNKTCPSAQRAECGHLYGFVYFRQMKNAQLPRGYFQKSIVILTRLPFINLYYKLADLIAPVYFQQASPDDRLSLLQRLIDEVSTWPSIQELYPTQGSKRQTDNMQLKLLNKLFDINLSSSANGVMLTNKYSPSAEDASSEELGSSENGTSLGDSAERSSNSSNQVEVEILSSVHEIDLFKHLECVVKDIHLIWELVMINEPIIVIGNSPSICSQVVQSIISLISPLLYCGEVRPYFTIHDTEFKEFTQLYPGSETDGGGGKPTVAGQETVSQPTLTGRKNCILGVTNPFFIKTLKNWPHIIRLDSSQLQQPSSNGAEFIQKSYLKTSHKRFLNTDKTFIKKIQSGIKLKRPYFVQTILLRRHFAELTESFLIPLERYLASLMPLKRAINPYKLEPPQPKEFNEADFMQTIDQFGPQLTTNLKGDWPGLYRRFFQSSNFKFWLEQRFFELKKQLQLLQLEALAIVDIKTWSLGKKEVELVDLVLKIKQKLNFLQKEFLYDSRTPLAQSGGDILEATQNLCLTENNATASSNDSNRDDDQRQRFLVLKQQLLEQIDKLKALLPDDLKNIL